MKTKKIIIRLSREEHTTLLNEMDKQGYSNLSHYVRSKCFNPSDNIILLEKLHKIQSSISGLYKQE